MRVGIFLICFICTILGAACKLGSFESDILAEVTAHSWRKTVVIEQLEKQTSEAWETELPKDAKVLSKRQEIHHYDGKVLKIVSETRTRKYECGRERIGLKPPFQYVVKYCDEQYKTDVEKEVDDVTKPVFATKVKYEIEIWKEKEKKDFTGYDKDISKITTVEVDNKTTRLGTSSDSFTVELKTPDGGKHRQNVTKEVFEKLNEGSSVKCRIDLNKTLSNCEF